MLRFPAILLHILGLFVYLQTAPLFAISSEYMARTGESSVTLQFDDARAKTIRQIRFKFTEPVTIAGALPRKAQTNAITVEGEHFPECRWRFLDTQTLSCELIQALPLNSQFTFTVRSDFPMLSSTLGADYQFELETARVSDVSQITIDYGRIHFSWDASTRIFQGESNRFRAFSDFEDSPDYFEEFYQHIELRKPDGVTEPVLAEIESGTDVWTWRAEIFLAESGLYKVQLPAGLVLSGTNQPLENPLVLKQVRVYDEFRWLGYRCLTGDRAEPWRTRENGLVNDDTAIACKTGALQLRFSHEFLTTANTTPTTLGYRLNHLPWSSEPAFLHKSYTQEDEESLFVVTAMLLPNREYVFDLNEIWQQQFADKPLVKAPPNDQVTLSIGAFPGDWWPIWDDSFTSNNLIYAQQDKPIQIALRYAEDMSLEVIAISSPEHLQDVLNNQSKSTQFQWEISEQATGNLYELPLEQMLETSGQLRVLAASGLPEKPGIVQRNAFHLNILPMNEWLIFAWDMQGQPLSDVDVYLVCSDQNAPLKLGSTDQSGFLKREPEWPSDSKQTCWLWGTYHDDDLIQADGESTFHLRHSSIPLLKRSWVSQLESVVGTIITTQEQVRHGDTLYVTIEMQHRHLEALDPDKIELKLIHGQKSFDLKVSDVSENGLATAQFLFDDTLPIGYFSAELRYSGRMLHRKGVILNHFVAPEVELLAQSELDLSDSQWLQIQGELKRISRAAMADHAINLELSFWPTYSIRAPNSWPSGWSFDFSYNNTSDEASFEHEVTLITDQWGKFQAHTELPNNVAKEGPTAANVILQEAPKVHGNLRWHVNTTAVTGEQLRQEGMHTIFGLPAYPAFRHEKNGGFSVRLVNAQGEWLNDDFVVQLRDIYSDTPIPSNCRINENNARCDYPEGHPTFTVVVTVGENEFSGRFSSRNNVSASELKLQLPEALYTRTSDGVSGSRADFAAEGENQIHVHSEEAKDVFLFVFTDRVQHSEWLSVAPGSNAITLPVTEEWGQAASIVVVHFDALNGHQFLHEDVPVKHFSEPIHLTMKVAQPEINLGERVMIELHSELASEVQLWLVDESLIVGDLARVPELNNVRSLSAGRWQSAFSTFSAHRYNVRESLEQGFYTNARLESFLGSYSTRRRTPPPPPNFGNLNTFTNHHPEWVLWQPRIILAAGETQSLTLELPARATSWRVIAVAATKQQREIVEQRLSVQSAFEFSIEAAEYSYEGDQLSLAVSATQRRGTQREHIHLNLNGELLDTVVFELEPGQSQRQTVRLPALPTGQYGVSAHDEEQTQVRTLQLNVRSAWVQSQQSLWPRGSDNIRWQLPESATNVSFYQLGGALQIDWSALREKMLQSSMQTTPQRLNAALLLSILPDAYVEPEDEALVAQLIEFSMDYGYRYFQMIPQHSFIDDDLLNAYSFLVLQKIAQHRYGEYATKLLEHGRIQSRIKEVLKRSNNAVARAFALWGLTEYQDLDFDAFQTLAQHLIVEDEAQEILVYLASLERFPEAESLRGHLVDRLQDMGYQSGVGPVFRHTWERCLVLHGYPQAHPLKQQEKQDLLLLQRTQGSFASVIAGGLCVSALVKGGDDNEPQTELAVHGNELGSSIWELDLQSPQSALFSRYQSHYTELPSRYDGVQIVREYALLRGEPGRKGEWQPLDSSSQLQLGDRVRVTLKIQSPVDYEHVVIRDSVPGGWYVNRSGFFGSRSVFCMYHCHQTIEPQQIGMYRWRLSAGLTELDYVVEVRNSGTFLAPGATVETLFRSDVRGRSASEIWQVKE